MILHRLKEYTVRIGSVEIDNFLSFRGFTWTDVDHHLNVIVGPNGAGKTNFFQAIRMVLHVVSSGISGEQGRALLPQALHRGDATHPLRIALNVTFDTIWEQALLRTFLAAALSEDGGFNIPGQDGARRLATFWYQKLPELDTSFLYTGRLVLTYDPFSTWSMWYESASPDFAFQWDLGPTERGFSATASTNEWQGSFLALQQSYTKQEGEQLQQYVIGILEDLQLPPPNMQRVLNGRNMRFQVSGNNAAWSRIHRQFVTLAGLTPPYDPTWYTSRFVFEQLLQRTLMFTDNVRHAAAYTVTGQDLSSPILDLSDGEQLPLYLMQQKNTQGAQYQEIKSLFQRLMSTQFEIGIARVQQRTRQTQPDTVSLDLTIDTSWGKIPLAFSGAGRAEALFLSALLAGNTGKIVLLDEPAQNLHPGIQIGLMNEIRNKATNQFFVVTHSPAFMLPDVIEQVSRFYLMNDATHRVSMQVDQMREQQRSTLQKELRGSSDMRAWVFARGVILVEGDMELGALPVWYRDVMEHYLENDQLAIHSVGGHFNFETYVRFLEGYQVAWAIVCDGAIIGDPKSPDKQRRACRIVHQLERAGVGDLNALSDIDQQPFSTRCELLEAHGVFTVAQSSEQGYEGFEESISGMRAKMDEIPDRSPVRKGRRVAEDNSCPPEVEELLQKLSRYLERQR